MLVWKLDFGTLMNLFRFLLGKIQAIIFFFLGEACFSLSIRPRQGRSPRGDIAVHIVPGFKNKNISICADMFKSGLFHFEVSMNTYNTTKFLEFFENCILKLEEQGFKDAIITMDNVPFHKSTTISSFILGRGHRISYCIPTHHF